MTKTALYVASLIVAGFPPRVIRALSPREVEKVATGKAAEVLATKFPKAVDILRAASKVDPERTERLLKEKGIVPVCFLDEVYPEPLRNIPSFPPVLFVKGRVDVLSAEPKIAVVGTRMATSYGRRVTRELTTQLAKMGFIIVSGMAVGIDTEAHKAAIDAGGRTIAVLGCGVDIVYPPENFRLYNDIQRCGCVVSELPPGLRPQRHFFPARNRIIAGMSIGVVVTEAPERSGALITAGFAAEYGREVFSVPGSVFSPFSRGNHALIKTGAKLTESVKDIIEELPQVRMEENVGKTSTGEVLSGDEKTAILRELSNPAHPDEIARRLGIPAGKLQALLTELEIEGKVGRLPGGLYTRLG